jgi:hypothetical protein
MNRHSGFTLTEITISMLVFAVAILTVLALLPSGYRTQSIARQQLFAASLATTMMDAFHHPITPGMASWGEGYGNSGSSSGRAMMTWRGVEGNWKDGAFSPSRGFAWMNYSSVPLDSITDPDFERLLTNRINGLIPLPDMIARRLDSDSDEIKRILDAGGKLYYVDPGVVRGLKWGHKFDLAKSDAPKAFRTDVEIHRIIVGVNGYPQQNAILVDPIESWPWYELYPFPPGWMSGRGLTEIRSMVVQPSGPGVDRNGDDDNSDGGPAGDITHADGGHLYFIYNTGVQPLNGVDQWSEQGWLGPQWESRVRLAMRRLAAGDTPTGSELMWMSSPHSATPNDEVWQSFRRLAIGDFDRSIAPTNRNVPSTDINAPLNSASTQMDDTDGVGDGGLDGMAGWVPLMNTQNYSSSYLGGWPDVNGTGGNSDATDMERTEQPGSKDGFQPTYEVRASYRDRAIALWNAVRPQGFPALQRASVSGTGVASPFEVTNVIGDVEQYEVPPSELAKFALVDPYRLHGTTLAGRSQFPPHPVQVLALSFLAHSAMAVTGQRPPFRMAYRALDAAHAGAPDVPLYDNRSPFYQIRIDSDPTNISKDIKILDAATTATDSSFQLRNDTTTSIIVYPGDCLWFEGTNIVLEIGNPAPVVIQGATPRTLNIARAFTASESGYTPTGTNQIGSALSAGTRCLRVANLADMSFARVAHEMSIRWAMAYGRESALDWGAPRPANNMVATDRPIAIRDLWFDAGPLAGDPEFFAQPEGQAQRRRSNRPMDPFSSGAAQGAWASRESFYRWMYPRNNWGGDPVTGNPSRPSNYGTPLVRYRTTNAGGDASNAPNGSANGTGGTWITSPRNNLYGPTVRLTDWRQHDQFWSMWHNRHLREPSPGSDRERYWLNRPFHPNHRTRELVFWSCEWKQYEDAEIVPSATIDQGKHGTFPSRINNNRVDSMSTIGFNTNYSAGNFHLQHPEGWLAWTGPDRAATSEASQSGSTNPASLDSQDIIFGHYGADRNANGRLDRGPIPASARMRATTLVRMNFYDPVLTLHAGN